ncbi:hypothetical protein, partial [Oceanobacillus massiliensis]
MYSYYARESKSAILFLFVLNFLNLLSKPIEISGFLLASVLIMFILFVALFIGFRLTIGRDTLRYEVLLMRFPVYAKEISAGQIKKIHFKRVNWSTKAA